jgi:hypothetical protein
MIVDVVPKIEIHGKSEKEMKKKKKKMLLLLQSVQSNIIKPINLIRISEFSFLSLEYMIYLSVPRDTRQQ